MFASQIARQNVSRAFMQQRNKSTIATVSVFGSGLMGSGIVQVTASNPNMKVYMVDVEDKFLQNGLKTINTSLGRIAKKKFGSIDTPEAKNYIQDVMSRISVTTNGPEAASKSDLVVEAIVENIKIKQDLFSSLDKVAPKHTIFASNTSSLPISQISATVSQDRKTKFGGLHFFNPVPQMKLVEVIKTKHTSQETYQALMDYSKNIGKTAVTCNDTPGFIVNRLLVPYMAEAIRLVERGDVEILKDVDEGMKLGAGYPMGPFELMDYVGLDTLKFILDGWHTASDSPLKGKELSQPCGLLNHLVEQKMFGRKSGKGFYIYEGKEVLDNPAVQAYLKK